MLCIIRRYIWKMILWYPRWNSVIIDLKNTRMISTVARCGNSSEQTPLRPYHCIKITKYKLIFPVLWRVEPLRLYSDQIDEKVVTWLRVICDDTGLDHIRLRNIKFYVDYYPLPINLLFIDWYRLTFFDILFRYYINRMKAQHQVLWNCRGGFCLLIIVQYHLYSSQWLLHE